MNEYDPHPHNPAEALIAEVFSGREREADVPIAMLRLEHKLRQMVRPRPPRQRRVRTGIKLAAFAVTLFLLGGWAGELPLPSWDDGQQIAVQLPASFVPAAYPHWVAVFANYASTLADSGGHSLVVDYKQAADSSYYLELGLLGVDYSEANDWLRSVMKNLPELQGTPYAITQPLLPYRVTLREMLGYKLFGHTEAVERNVVRAWLAAGGKPKHVYLIARPKDYAKRVSMLDL